MSKFLNKYDKMLHDSIHKEMLHENPEKLLENPRVCVIDKVYEILGNIKGTVADVGCGSGYFSIALAKRFHEISRIDAIDASEFAVNKVIPRNIKHYGLQEKIKVQIGSYDKLPISTYDAVFAMGALHHSRHLTKSLETIFSSLKNGGFLIAQEPAMPDTTTHSEYEFKYNI